MKKIFLLVVLLSLILCGCQSKQEKISEDLNINGIESMIIKVLPSPPKMKAINKEEDIKSIIEYINHISKQRIEQEDMNGWEVLIQTDGEQKHSIKFIADMLEIDDVWYRVGETEVEKIKDLYNKLDYDEERVNSK